MNDVTYAVRALRKAPRYLITSVLVLSVAIGAVAVVFSAVDAVLLRPLPFENSESVFRIWANDPEKHTVHGGLSPLEYLEVMHRCNAFQGFGAIATVSGNLAGGLEPRNLYGAKVTEGFFSVPGTRIVRGRPFASGEFTPGRDTTIVLSEEIWKEQFGSSERLIGESIILDSKIYIVVGIARVASAISQSSESSQDFWIPLAQDEAWRNDARRRDLILLGVLRRGFSTEAAEAELHVLSQEGNLSNPERGKRALEAVRLRDVIVSGVRRALMVILSAAVLLLLISYVNLANLALIRSASRRREIAVRIAVGAPRYRIIRMLFAENLLLSGAGGLIGTILTAWGTYLFRAFAPSTIPRAADVRLDGMVVALIISISLFSSVVLGLACTPSSSLSSLQASLKGEGGAAGGRLRFLFGLNQRSVLVIAELALSVVLLSGLALLSVSLNRFLSVTLGFEPHNVLTFWVSLPSTRYHTQGQRTAFFHEALDRMARLRNVTVVGIASNAFFGGSSFADYHFDGEADDPATPSRIEFRLVSAGFLSALRVHIEQGRLFDDAEDDHGESGVIVNQAFERNFGSGKSILGKRVFVLERARTVVGVVGNIRDALTRGEVPPTIYIPFFGYASTSAMVAIRTEGDPNSIVQSIRAEISSMDREQPIRGVSTLDKLVSKVLELPRFRVFLVTFFGGCGYLLTLVGVYGVTSYTVTQRRREIAIRMALGGTPESIFRHFVFLALCWVLAGLCIGFATTFAFVTVIGSLLYDVRPHDPIILTGVGIFVCVTAIMASIAPALRAMRTDLAQTLRHEQ